MSVQAARRVLLERYSAADLAMVALVLDGETVPGFADGADVDGRAVQLIGAHALRTLPQGEDYVAEVLAGLGRGTITPGVHTIYIAPKASEALVAIVESEALEVLLWGSRTSGKTIDAAIALLSLSECHVRAGFPLPLKALWLHASLVDAAMKSAASLEEPAVWSGVWQLQSDRHVAIARVGASEHVYCDFVGVQDVTTVERVRSSAHVIVAEELIATLDDQGGIPERAYEIAITSMERLTGRRRVAFSTTNPGSREHWAFKRFLADDHDPRRVACHIPSRDRLTDEQIEAQGRPFRDSPDLKARLIDEQWVDLRLGPEVCVGFSHARHVAPHPLELMMGTTLYHGLDTAPGSHVHASVLAQRNGPQLRIFAGLVSANAGLKQHLDSLVLPWLLRRCRWILGKANAREWLVNVVDPAALAAEGGDVDQSAERRVRETIGGTMRVGAVHWMPRISPLLALLNPNSDVLPQFDPGPDCAMLIRAVAGLWHYDQSRGGAVERDAPAKNERLFADLGDALCYVVGEMQPSRKPKPRGWAPTKQRVPVSEGTARWLGLE
jgi:hypothetical protein